MFLKRIILKDKDRKRANSINDFLPDLGGPCNKIPPPPSPDITLDIYPSSLLGEDKLIEKMKDIGSKVAEKVPQTSINNPTTH